MKWWRMEDASVMKFCPSPPSNKKVWVWKIELIWCTWIYFSKNVLSSQEAGRQWQRLLCKANFSAPASWEKETPSYSFFLDLKLAFPHTWSPVPALWLTRKIVHRVSVIYRVKWQSLLPQFQRCYRSKFFNIHQQSFSKNYSWLFATCAEVMQQALYYICETT